MNQKNQMQSPASILKTAILKYKKIFLYAFIFSFTINLLTLSISVYSLQIYDRVLSSSSIETLLMLTIIVGIALLFLGFLSMIRNFVFSKISQNLDDDLAKDLLSKSITASTLQTSIQPTQMLRDFLVVKNFISGHTMHTLFDAPWAILFIIATFFVHYINGLVVLGAALLLLFLAFCNDILLKEDSKKANELSVKNLTYIETVSRNSEVIESMGMKKDILSHWNKLQKEALILEKKVNEKSNFISSVTKTIRLFIQMAMMGIGAYLVIQRQMTSGGIMATSILSGKALAPFETGIATWKSVLSFKKSYSRLDAFLQNTLDLEINTLLPEPKGSFSVEKVFFSPNPTAKPIIKGVSFEINQGESIAIIGPSGAGKTTLAKLLVGIYKPTSGNVRLDGADIYRWDKTHLGKFVGYLPQDIELFKGHVKTNIARMQEDFDENEVLKATQIVNANDMILRLPNGYETEVGVGGNHLSSGQSQLIGLARAFYGNPKIVILDEPNSHLDNFGEQCFLNTIDYAKQNNITTIIIAHRTSILSIVDKILILQDGMVKLFDTREKVIAQLSAKQ
jgi:PrtD family type I secretion system ABC transporter